MRENEERVERENERKEEKARNTANTANTARRIAGAAHPGVKLHRTGDTSTDPAPAETAQESRADKGQDAAQHLMDGPRRPQPRQMTICVVTSPSPLAQHADPSLAQLRRTTRRPA